jgi:hypothetical protein
MSLPYDSREHQGIVLVVPVKALKEPATGSVVRQCSKCKQDVWVSPESLTVHEREEVPLVCWDHIQDFIEGKDL